MYGVGGQEPVTCHTRKAAQACVVVVVGVGDTAAESSQKPGASDACIQMPPCRRVGMLCPPGKAMDGLADWPDRSIDRSIA